MVPEAVLATSNCSRCGRPLKDPKSKARGMGPVCAARLRAELARKKAAATGVLVTVNGQPLEHIVLHSPTGMEWGYAGSGPADLALSILHHYLGGDRQLAEELHQTFKFDFVARFDRAGWRLTGEEIARWLESQGVLPAPVRPVVYEGRRVA